MLGFIDLYQTGGRFGIVLIKSAALLITTLRHPRRVELMAKIMEIRKSQNHNVIPIVPECREMEETAAQIVALMQARFSKPTPKEMLKILHCTEGRIFAMRN
jgi:hypothetical protein